MITKSKHIEAVIRKHWRELIKGGDVMWIDGYNNAVHRKFVTTIQTNVDTSNLYFFNDPRKANSNKPISGRKLHAPCQPRRDESEQRNYPPPHRLRFAQTAFMVVLPRTTTKYLRGTSSEDSENRQ